MAARRRRDRKNGFKESTGKGTSATSCNSVSQQLKPPTTEKWFHIRRKRPTTQDAIPARLEVPRVDIFASIFGIFLGTRSLLDDPHRIRCTRRNPPCRSRQARDQTAPQEDQGWQYLWPYLASQLKSVQPRCRSVGSASLWIGYQ